MNAMFKRKRIFCTVIMVTLYVFLRTACAEALMISIKRHAMVAGNTIRLGDVADFSPANDPRVPGLSKISLGSAPLPAKSLNLNHRYLIYRLKSPLSGLNDVKVKIPRELIVKRKAQKISVKKLKKIYVDFIKKQAPWPDDKMEIRKVSVTGPVYLPMGEASWTVRTAGSKRWIGELPVIITFFVNGKVVKKVPANGRIFVKIRIVKASRKINAGEIITRDDLILTNEMVDSLKEGLLDRTELAVGKRIRRPLIKGQYITKRMLEDLPLVKKGQRVIIFAENDTIRISTVGKALENGKDGDEIKVVNISSGREIFATVTGPGRVSVSF